MDVMIKAYNFLGSWQLFPEKGTYEFGDRPRSGIYKIESADDNKQLIISHSWTSLDNQGFSSDLRVSADAEVHNFENPNMADKVQLSLIDSISFETVFYKAARVILRVMHEIQPNGYLKITQQGTREDESSYTNTEFYYKQMSVLPYSASVSGALIRPTEEGVIRHKALTAMEEQTNMQLEQIRKQIELLALQAQEVHKRKELSMLIYNARISFKPEIGQVYYLYQKKDDGHMILLISPTEWGPSMPFKKFIATVQLLADHTWKEL
jgi:hypothetical protein